MSSNSQVIVIDDQKNVFEMAMKIAFFDTYTPKKATHYVIQTPSIDKPFFDRPNVQHPMKPAPTQLFEVKHSRMILYWHHPGDSVVGVTALPYPMSVDDVIPFVWGLVTKSGLWK